MTPGIDNDTIKMISDFRLVSPPAEFRAATAVISPIVKLLELQNGAITQGEATSVRPLHFDSWLFETLFVIDSYRDVSEGWDGYAAPAPSKKALDASEMLSAFFALADYANRPTLCVDSFGRPSFAVTTPDLYLHLTVDAAGKLTWYSVVDGEEGFADEVDFDGRRLPEQLQGVFFSQR